MFKQFIIDNYGPVFFSFIIVFVLIAAIITSEKRENRQYNIDCMKLGYEQTVYQDKVIWVKTQTVKVEK